jgi:hypothetical protein
MRPSRVSNCINSRGKEIREARRSWQPQIRRLLPEQQTMLTFEAISRSFHRQSQVGPGKLSRDATQVATQQELEARALLVQSQIDCIQSQDEMTVAIGKTRK